MSTYDHAALFRTGRELVSLALAELVKEGKAPKLAQEWVEYLLREVSLHLYRVESVQARHEQDAYALADADPFNDR